jgi:ribosomal protein L37E
MTLSPVEKVVLARSHKVAKWLTEGLTEIVTENPIRPFDELKSLGLETAGLLLWIRDQTVSHANVQGLGLHVTLGSLGCYSCKAAMFTSPANCRSCGRQILVNDPEAIYICGCSVQIQDSGTSGPGRSQVIFNLQYLRCQQCANYPINYTTHYCPSCGYGVSYQNFRLLSSSFRAKQNTDVTVDEVFKEEIASYESWDH